MKNFIQVGKLRAYIQHRNGINAVDAFEKEYEIVPHEDTAARIEKISKQIDIIASLERELSELKSKFKPKLKLSDMGEKDCVHSPDKELAIKFCQLMKSEGKRWSSGVSYDETRWTIFKKNTCYRPGENAFCKIDYYKRNNFTIHNAEDFFYSNPEVEKLEKEIESMRKEVVALSDARKKLAEEVFHLVNERDSLKSELKNYKIACTALAAATIAAIITFFI